MDSKTSSPQNILTNNNMDVEAFWKADKNKKKPKYITRKGKYTKKFLEYNKQLIKNKKVNNYIDNDFLFNPVTNKIIKKQYDKRYKKKKVLKKTFLKKYPNLQNNIILVPKTKLKYSFKSGDDAGTLKNLLKKNKISGNVKFIFYVGNKIIKEFNSNITTINKWFENNYLKFTLSENSDNLNWLWNTNNIKMIVTKETQLNKNEIQQLFKDSKNSMCFFNPIINYYKTLKENATSHKRKKDIQYKLNYIEGRLTKTKFKQGIIHKHGGGMPSDEKLLNEFSNALNIGFDIDQPFQEKPFLHIRPLKKAGKIFRYINSRLNHVESIEKNNWFDNLFNNDYKEIKYVDRDELYNIIDECEKKDIMCIFGKDNLGINKVKTTNNYYSMSNDFNDTVSEFEKEIGFDSNFHVDYNIDSDLSNFLISSTHYNTTIDFKDLYDINVNDSCIRQVDMVKAYSQFQNCKYYNGFMGLIVHSIRPMNDYKNLKGCFFITELNIPEGKFKLLNEKMGMYFSNNIYYDCELDFLKDQGCTFKITHGVVGEKYDFKFNNQMLENKVKIDMGNGREIKVPYYSKWCGMKGHISHNKSFFMRGDKKYFENLRNTHDIYNDGVSNEYRVSYPKRTVTHATHITAQVTAYQRLGMIEQLMNMELEKILRVCVDGIYYINHEFSKCEKVIFDYDKEKKQFSNWMSCDNYVTNILENVEEKKWTCDNIEREYNKVELHLGMGGCGKTHYNLVDKGLYNSCFIAPSWFLSCDKKHDYKLKNNNVLARLSNVELPYWKELMTRYNNFIIDECSMITEETKQFIIKNFKGGIYYCGDLGYQLPPVGDLIEMNSVNMKIIKHEKNYRCQDKELYNILVNVRKLIEENKKVKFDSIINKFQNISFEEVVQSYKVKDTIITSENIFIEEINKYITKEKYMVTNNTNLYKNGEILFNKPEINGISYVRTNAFTIHKIQGKTAEHKLFIDKRKLKSLRMLYTALSRAKRKEQIYFF